MPKMRPLFDTSRNTSRSNDKKIAKKANAKLDRVAPTIRGGGSLLNRIMQIQQMVEQNLGMYREKYQIIQTEEELKAFVDNVIACGEVAIDTETTGLDPLQDMIAGVCVYSPNQPSAYIPINHISYITELPVPNQLPSEVVRDEFQRFLDAHVDIIMFNADFDIRVCRHGLGLKDIYCTWDCYLAQRILNENEEVNKLKPLHKKYVLNGEGDAFTFDELFKGIPFTMIPLQTAYLYAAHDPEITYEFYKYQRKYLREDSPREDMRKLYRLMMDIEMPCVPVVADMEDNGVLLDLECNERLKDKYHKLLDEREAKFHEMCEPYRDEIEQYRKKHNNLDEPINIKSTKQLCILLYDILGLEMYYDKKAKKLVKTTKEEHLATLDHDVARAILDYREFSTVVDTFIDKLPNCINPNDGRIHCKFNQYGADTGRFSSSDPNMQNIPSHVKDIRQMFVASNDTVEVIGTNDSFTVDKFSEVNTVDGWKYASCVSVGDKLVVDDDGERLEIIVRRIESLVDKNQIVYYV